MRRNFALLPLLIVFAGTPASAQLALPALPGLGLPNLPRVIDPVTRTVDGIVGNVAAKVEQLAELRVERIERLVRQHPDAIALDIDGEPARLGELLVMDADDNALARAGAAGFAVAGVDEIEGLGIAVTRLAVPQGMSLAQAQERLATLMPDATVSSDPLHFQSGAIGTVVAMAGASRAGNVTTPVGVIDGAPGVAVNVTSQRGFAKGAPIASNHGSAVASLLKGAGARNVNVADVYGTDPAGGNALAIARGLGWLVAKGSRVVTISLVGPKNAVLERAIGAAQKRGIVVVAAVGNDGPAAPPAYPASYQGVVAVTAVDGRNRALIEAGRALHLDYTAPGADIRARNKDGKWRTVRGTSFATPLAAVRIAAALDRDENWRTTLAGETRDLGPKGHDDTFGNGLICGRCGRR
ncbi:S8 family serine peptidase [Croceicoccus bisphenolivorans]|uniref:S8 family serine peptidase n=1 Tax=Croceicoccus bisphenolivorans TaxID=1783232 RepID=UPI000AF393A1|nr:S8 family serine peptidase [Croceicoccus bisphenolivorans]